MSSRTNYLIEKWLNHITNQEPYTPPEKLYLAMFTVAPDRTGGGTEVTGGSYIRRAVVWDEVDLTDWSVVNKESVSFTGMPATDVIATGLYDAQTAGNLCYFEVYDVSEAVSEGQVVVFAEGDIKIDTL